MVKSWTFKALLVSTAILLLLPSPRAHEFSEAAKKHWAFQPLRKLNHLPITTEGNLIDAFLQKELSSRNLTRNPPADKVTLIRRASLDLVGLPPTPEEVQEFLADSSPDAFQKVIERLLRSPHYGEKAARHWLDLARYAESEGFKADETRPNIWRYRDYVISSFNQDKPYDRFIMEQIAGDELWLGNHEALIATGFNRHYPDESNARNLMQRRQEILNDITDTVGSVFTGLTFACARCHDHKYDPILQADYYRLQAFFANSAAADGIPLLSPLELAQYHQKLAHWEELTREIRDQISALEASKRQQLINDYIEKYPPIIQQALKKPPAERTPFECQMVAKAELYLTPTSHQYLASSSIVVTRLSKEDKARWEELNAQLAPFKHLHPGELPLATGIRDLSSQAPPTYLLLRGNWDGAREEIPPGFLALLDQTTIQPVQLPPEFNSTGRRAALARLLADPANPLTARVMVNRIWQQHFAKGLVETSSDFGMKGEPPTHPELLDFLAQQFIASGWSIKHMHKLIMLSAAYQQSSAYNAHHAQRDPSNKYLWRFPRHRLQGELIRDAALHVSGLLNPQLGGPSVFPELPPALASYGGWKTSSKPEERNRRSIYVFVRRNMRYPLFESFDMPDTHESCSRRNTTTSPIQALSLLNNKVSLEWAQGFAARVLLHAHTDQTRQIETAYLLAYSRSPSAEELKMAAQFLHDQGEIISARLLNQEPIALPLQFPEQLSKAQGAALVDFCHMIFNSNEFIYIN